MNFLARKDRLEHPPLHPKVLGVTDRVFGADLSNLYPDRRSNSRNQPRLRNHSHHHQKPIKPPPQRSNSNNGSFLLEKLNKLLNQPPLPSKESSREVKQTRAEPKQFKSQPAPASTPPSFADEAAILSHLFASQQSKSGKFHAGCSFTESNRANLVEWIIEVHSKLRLGQRSLHMTVSLLNSYLESAPVSRQRLQLSGLCCLLIAAKFEETYRVPSLKDLSYLSANAYSADEFKNEEARIIESRKFQLHEPTAEDYLHYFAVDMEDKQFYLTRYLLELSFVRLLFSKHKASLLCAAAVFLVNKIRNRPRAFNQRLLSTCRQEEGVLRGVSKQLCQLLQETEREQFRSVRRKYGSAEFKQVSRIRIQKKTALG